MTSSGIEPATFELVAVPQPTTLPCDPSIWRNRTYMESMYLARKGQIIDIQKVPPLKLLASIKAGTKIYKAPYTYMLLT
jgi:hypothetical protein